MDLRELVRQAIAAADRAALEHNFSSASFRFGDLTIDVHLNGSGSTRRLLQMIANRSCEYAHDAVHLDVIDAPLPEFIALLPAEDERHYTVLRANSEIYYLWLDEGGGYLTALDRRARRGVVWFAAPDRMASWHVARPFLHAIKGFSRDTAWTPIHAAAIAKGGRGILLVGQSGAGKTSIAVGCALAGWDYLGDDAVMVRPNPSRVAALYSSARLRADMFQTFPRAMTASLGISDDAGEQKAEIDMSTLGCCGCAEATIQAIVFPVADDGAPGALREINRPDAVRKLMEATWQSIKGDETVTFDKLAAIVARVPCVSMQACHDQVALSRTLTTLVEADGGA